MEILAIVVLGVSALVGFSTSERKSKLNQVDRRNQEDPDWSFTQACDAEGSKGQ